MTRFYSTKLAIALFATSALASPVIAQSADVQPPPRDSVDQNGVDLATGEMRLATPSISIGPASAGLSFQRETLELTGSAGWTNPYKFAIYGNPASSVQVVAGSRSVNFNFNSGTSTWLNQQGTGETLTVSGSTWTFTLRDGTVVVLDKSPFNPAANDLRYEGLSCVAAAKSIMLPNKETLTPTYRMITWDNPLHGTISRIRLQGIQSSNGYMAKYDYADNGTQNSPTWQQLVKLTLLNNAIDYCNPGADTCTYSTTWPSLTFTYVTGAQPEVDTITDTLNRSTEFTFGYLGNANGKLQAVRRPTSATDNTTIAYDANGRVQSVTTDGRTWGYSWSLAAPLMTATVTNPDMTQRVYVTNTTLNQVTS